MLILHVIIMIYMSKCACLIVLQRASPVQRAVPVQSPSSWTQWRGIRAISGGILEPSRVTLGHLGFTMGLLGALLGSSWSMLASCLTDVEVTHQEPARQDPKEPGGGRTPRGYDRHTAHRVSERGNPEPERHPQDRGRKADESGSTDGVDGAERGSTREPTRNSPPG